MTTQGFYNIYLYRFVLYCILLYISFTLADIFKHSVLNIYQDKLLIIKILLKKVYLKSNLDEII